MQNFHDSQGEMMTGIAELTSNMDSANKSNAVQLDFLAAEVQDMRDGQKELGSGLQQILDRLPEQKRKGTIARKLRVNNTQLRDSLLSAPADVSMETSDCEDFSTQDPEERGQVGSRGC